MGRKSEGKDKVVAEGDAGAVDREGFEAAVVPMGEGTEAVPGDLAGAVAEAADAAPGAGAGFREGLVAVVAGERVEVSESVVGILAAGEVETKETLVLFGMVGELSGDARVLMDLRAALAGGAVLALVLGLISFLSGRRHR